MSRTHAPLPPTDLPAVVEAFGLVDAKDLAGMIGLSHRTVMVYAAQEAWRTGHLPPPVYIGARHGRTAGRNRRWRRATVRAWVAAADAAYRDGVA